MKKQYSLVLLLLAVSFALPVFAEEDNVSTSSSPSVTERREQVKHNIEQRRASTTERRVERRQALAKRRVENVTRAMLATIDRLEKIIVRIESRIEKVKGEGGNTTEVESFVALAKENLANANVAVDTFSQLDLSGSAGTVLENSDIIRAAAIEAREDIRAARENLVKAVRALKGPNTGNQ